MIVSDLNASKVVNVMTYSEMHVKVGDSRIVDTDLIYSGASGLQASS